MTYLNISKDNIKLNFVDKEATEDENCFLEIKINVNYLKQALFKYENINFEGIKDENGLTKREIQILKYLSNGHNNFEIAKEINVSVHTVKVHIHNIFTKLSVQDRTEAVVKAIKNNIIKI